MEISSAQVVGPATVGVISLLAFLLRRNVKANDDRISAAEDAAEKAGAEAKIAVTAIAERVSREIASSGETTRAAIAGVSADVKALGATLAGHGERLAEGNVKIETLTARVGAIEDRERTRDREIAALRPQAR